MKSREEILAMEAGPEMDALVAERVMGCKPIKERHGYRCDCSKEFRKPHADETIYGDKCHSYSGLNCDNSGLAHYSTDIGAAWKVVEKLGDGWIAVVQRDNGTDWLCDIGDIGQFKPRKHGQATGSAPLAICRAALLIFL